MAYNRYYLKIDDEKQIIVDGGVNQPNEKELSVMFFNENRYSFDDIKRMFTDLNDGIVIWMCIVQDDGTETDEMLSTNNKEFTKIRGIEYQPEYDIWKVTMTIPDETQERISELEDALNFLLMGGDM